MSALRPNLTASLYEILSKNLTAGLEERHGDLAKDLSEFLNNYTITMNETHHRWSKHLDIMLCIGRKVKPNLCRKWRAMNTSLESIGEAIANQSDTFIDSMGDELQVIALLSVVLLNSAK